MCEACTEIDTRFEAVAKAAAPLGSRLPRVRDPVLGRWIAKQMHALLRNITAGHCALDVVIGEGLDALNVGRRAMDLSYSNIGDYAREELGINASTATKMARLARRLRDRPLVREAVRQGELTPRKAEIIAPVAVGDDQARWILIGKAESVRSLNARVKAPADPDEEKWVNLCADVSPEQLSTLDEGLRLAGVIVGATATKMQRLNAWAEEFQGSHPAPPDQRADDVLFIAEDDLEPLKKHLEDENRQWAGLAAVQPLKAPHSNEEIDPWRIHAELKQHLEKRTRWDEVFGHVATLFKQSRAWELLGFASFGHYCEEQLGMAERTVMQRIALERSLSRIPLLRRALREKRISYEKARIIARHAQGEEVQGWIEKAETMTCVALRRAMQRSTSSRLGERSSSRRTRCSDASGPATSTSCQVPGCSRAAVHAHHIKPRSQGGSDDPENLISLCAVYHLFGIHGGRMRVTGTAPDKLVWEFGLRRSYVAA